VLGALQRTIPPLGMELKLRKTKVWGPGLFPASFPLAAAPRLHLEDAGHADPQVAQGNHCGLLQLRPGLDLPAAGCGRRADVGGLVLFPGIALDAQARGGKATRSSSTQACRLNCLSSVLDPLEELVARVKRDTPADGPRTRARTRTAASEAPDASSQASDQTAAAVRALLAEGTPGRDLRLLTFDGAAIRQTRQCWPA